MLKKTADALVYKGTVPVDGLGTDMPASRRGWTYKVKTDGYITGVKVNIGDMIICNQNTPGLESSTAVSSSTYFDFIQSNLDPTSYSVKGHKHSVTITNNTSDAGAHTPTGTISTTVGVNTITSKGNNKPQGTISGTYSTTSTQHSHSFTGTAATLTTTYMKAGSNTNAASTSSITIPSHTYTPAGSIELGYTTTNVAMTGSTPT